MNNNKTSVRRLDRVSDNLKLIIANLPKEDPNASDFKYPDTVGDTFIRKSAALANPAFKELEPGIYKEAVSEADYGKIWVEKSYNNPETGKDEKWLVSYVDDEENIIRTVANEVTTSIAKVASNVDDIKNKVLVAMTKNYLTNPSTNENYDTTDSITTFISEYPKNTELRLFNIDINEAKAEVESGELDNLLRDNYSAWSGDGITSSLKTKASDEELKTKIETFLDYPWQEDTEIDLVTTLNEYRDKLDTNPEAYKNYIASFVKANSDAISGSQMLGETFLDALYSIISKDTEASLNNETTPGKEGADEVNNQSPSEDSYKKLNSDNNIVAALLKSEAGDMKDMPIAPGIKSKNVTVDETGTGGTAKVTVEFTDADQGYKFYQELGGAAQAPAAPAEAAPAEGQPGGDVLEAQPAQAQGQRPATNVQGGQPQVASSKENLLDSIIKEAMDEPFDLPGEELPIENSNIEDPIADSNPEDVIKDKFKLFKDALIAEFDIPAEEIANVHTLYDMLSELGPAYGLSTDDIVGIAERFIDADYSELMTEYEDDEDAVIARMDDLLQIRDFPSGIDDL